MRRLVKRVDQEALASFLAGGDKYCKKIKNKNITDIPARNSCRMSLLSWGPVVFLYGHYRGWDKQERSDALNSMSDIETDETRFLIQFVSLSSVPITRMI